MKVVTALTTDFGKQDVTDSFPIYPNGSEHRVKILNVPLIQK
jgi:hypothetical protein